MQRDLADRARQGDHDAFSELAARSIGRLHAVATLIIRDRDRAEDAVQETFVAAWRDIRGLRDPDRFDAWLHRLLVRSCYRQLRLDHRRRIVELQVVPVSEPAQVGPELSAATRDQLDRGFRRLGADHCAVLVLHHYLGLSLDEVADILSIPRGTAKSRLNRAVGVMRAGLEADDRGPALETGRTA